MQRTSESLKSNISRIIFLLKRLCADGKIGKNMKACREIITYLLWKNKMLKRPYRFNRDCVLQQGEDRLREVEPMWHITRACIRSNFYGLCNTLLSNYFEDTYKYVHAARNIRQVLSQTANMPYLVCRLNKIGRIGRKKLLTPRLIVHISHKYAHTRTSRLLARNISSLQCVSLNRTFNCRSNVHGWGRANFLKQFSPDRRKRDSPYSRIRRARVFLFLSCKIKPIDEFYLRLIKREREYTFNAYIDALPISSSVMKKLFPIIRK